MKLFIPILLSIVLTVMYSCNKPVYKYNKDFEGNWLTNIVYDSLLNANVQSQIKIDGPDGFYNGICEVCSDGGYCNCLTVHTGKAVMNSDRTEMKIGSGGNTYPLRIEEEPNIDSDGNWTMKVQGLRFYKQ